MEMKQRGPSAFTVVALVSTTDAHVMDHWETIDEARGSVIFHHLKFWEIWQGDHIVDESHPNRTGYDFRDAARERASEALSYGVRCNECGMYETACECDGGPRIHSATEG